MIEWEKYAPKNKSSTSKFRNEFPNKKEAEDIAKKGRFGDTMIMHVNPAEVELLAQFAPGGITINPETGQPEAFLPLLAGIVPMITGALSSIGPALMAGIGAIGSGLGAVGGMIGTGLGAVGSAASSVLGSVGIGGGAGAAAAPSTVLATVPTATAEAALASAGTTAAQGAASIPAWMSGSGTPFMSALGVDATGAALPGSFSTLGSGGAAFTPAALPGAIPTGIINPALMGGQVPMNTGSMLAQTGSQMTPEMFTALQNAQGAVVPPVTPPVVAPVAPPVTPVTPTWAGSPLNPANMGANPAFPPTTGPWNPAPAFNATAPIQNIPASAFPGAPQATNSISQAYSAMPGGANSTPIAGVELPANLGEPLTIGESIAGMSDSSKLMALFGAGSLIDSLASDDFESEEEEYVNSYGAEYRPSWKENPYSRKTRRLAVGPGGSPDNINPRYYGSGIG